MAKLNISQAAKLAGVSRATLHKHLKAGKLSVSIEGDGSRVIDVAELEHVYGPLGTADTVSPQRKSLHSDTLDIVTVLQAHIRRLEHELDLLRHERDAERQAREREREDHRQERERRHGMLEKQLYLLPKPQEADGTPPKRTWWQRWSLR